MRIFESIGVFYLCWCLILLLVHNPSVECFFWAKEHDADKKSKPVMINFYSSLKGSFKACSIRCQTRTINTGAALFTQNLVGPCRCINSLLVIVWTNTLQDYFTFSNRFLLVESFMCNCLINEISFRTWMAFVESLCSDFYCLFKYWWQQIVDQC